MNFKKAVFVGLLVAVAGGATGWLGLDKETRGFLAAVPNDRNVLLESVAARRGFPGAGPVAFSVQTPRRPR